jgi:hypothetical protein
MTSCPSLAPVRSRLFTLLAFLLVGASASAQLRSPLLALRAVPVTQDAPATGAESGIDFPAERYLGHVRFFADDFLKGRGTGSDGIDISAGYIAGQFAAHGIEPGGENGTYFQEFSISRGARLLPETTLTFAGVDIEAKLNEDYVPFGFSAAGTFDAPLVFVGYGVTNTLKRHDDYAGVDVSGKVVLMFRREPPGWGDEEDDYSGHAMFDAKAWLAARRGARAVLVVNQNPGPEGDDRLFRFRGSGERYELPMLHVKRALAELLLAGSGLPALDDLQKTLDADGGHASAAVEGVAAGGNVAFEVQTMLARNVIGKLPGTGPHANEYIVIGGHYDHLGERRGDIHNGADDNASGTAGVIEIGRALARTTNRDRGVILMAFTGEELGLHGSRHYTRNPTVPVESIVAMLNMDMIGRLDHDSTQNMLTIHGVGTGDSYRAMVDRITSAAGITYLPDDSAIGPSDHEAFYRAGVPSLFFHSGLHPEYHRPGDDIEKINAEGGAEICRLVYDVAVELIGAGQRPTFVEVNRPANIFRSGRPDDLPTAGAARALAHAAAAENGPDETGSVGSSGARHATTDAAPGEGTDATRLASGERPQVFLGIMPDAQDDSDERGIPVNRVLPDGPAYKAGIRDGDRILSIDGRTIAGFEDYVAATQGHKPGDVVPVRVLRGQTEISVDVELASRG